MYKTIKTYIYEATTEALGDENEHKKKKRHTKDDLLRQQTQIKNYRRKKGNTHRKKLSKLKRIIGRKHARKSKFVQGTQEQIEPGKQNK